MSFESLIRKKRDGLELSPSEIQFFVEGVVHQTIPEYQQAAWLMAVFFQGLTDTERRELTYSMARSGKHFARKDSPRKEYWVDKHSTGGVGDKTSLILVPLVAAVCDRVFGKGTVRFPMVSGRGLGHTGGTLDKLESVPGFLSRLDLKRAEEMLQQTGFVMMGQTDEIAPADRVLYALRDVTATIESIPLIVASILSKKVAESLDGLVFDVKFGSGAFMKDPTQAVELAKALRVLAKASDLQSVAILTRMDEPLGRKVGNHLEVEECEDFLANRYRDPGLLEVVISLSAWMVFLAAKGSVPMEEASNWVKEELGKSVASSYFVRMFEQQGGRFQEYVENRRRLADSRNTYFVPATTSGYLSEIACEKVGQLVCRMGGGRMKKEDAVDPFVGCELLKKVGEPVAEGEPLVRIFTNGKVGDRDFTADWQSVFRYSSKRPVVKGWVWQTLST